MSDHYVEPIRILLLHNNLIEASHHARKIRELADFTVTPARADAALLERLSRRPNEHELVLVDGRDMRVEDGRKLAGQVIQQQPFMPVVLLTPDRSQEGQPDWAMRYGYQCYELRDDAPSGQLIAVLRRAARQRNIYWQRCFQQLSTAVQESTTDDTQVLQVCGDWLKRLGYADVSIHRHIHGWLVREPLGDGFHAVEHAAFLNCEYPLEPTAHHKQKIDLARHPMLQSILASAEPIKLLPDPEQGEQALLALHGDTWFDSSKKNLLGLLMLRKLPSHSLSRQEVDNLKALSQQITQAMLKALCERQLRYRRETEAQLRHTHERVLHLKPKERNTDDILHLFAVAIADSLKFERVAISTVIKEEYPLPEFPLGRLRVRAIHLPLPEQVLVHEMLSKPLDRGLFERLHRKEFLHHGSYFIPQSAYDAATYGAWIKEEGPSENLQPWEWHGQDLLRTPIRNAGGELLGYISVDARRNKRRPDENTFQALHDFSLEVAVAIENIWQRRESENFRTIEQLGLAFSKVGGYQDLFIRIEKELSKLMSFETILIGRYYHALEEIEVVYRNTVNAQDEDLPARRSVYAGLTGYIVRNKISLWFRSAEEIDDFLLKNPEVQPLGRPAQSWLGIPLIINDLVIGVLALQHFVKPNCYTRHHRRLLEALAGPIASAYRRVELEEEYRDVSDKFALKLASAESNLKTVELNILQQACLLSKADYAVLLHYEPDRNRLVLGESYPGEQSAWSDHSEYVVVPLDDPQKGDLSAIVARKKQPMRWGDIGQFPAHTPRRSGTRSQMSLPLLVSDEAAPDASARDAAGNLRLLGVLTLESMQPNAFTRAQQKRLENLCQFAALALLRSADQAKIRDLLAWGFYDLSSKIIGHEHKNELLQLHVQLRSLVQEHNRLAEELRDMFGRLGVSATTSATELERLAPVDLKAVIDRFLAEHTSLYLHSELEVRAETSLHAHERIMANEPCLALLLRRLVDDAYTLLHTHPYGTILVVAESSPEGVTLSVSAAGSVSGAGDGQSPYAEVVERSELAWLIPFLGATLSVEREGADGRIVRVLFPHLEGASVEAAPRDFPRSSWRRLPPPRRRDAHQLLATYRAQIFTASARTQARQLNDRLSCIADHHQRANKQLEELQEQGNIANLEHCQTLMIVPEVETFIASRKKLSLPHPLALVETALPRDTLVEANKLGLRRVLNILVTNAFHAIEAAGGDNQQPYSTGQQPRINISLIWQTTEDGQAVAIRIHNTGSSIGAETERLLFSPYLAKGNSGRGLYMAKTLIERYKGTIDLKENSQTNGVTFEILLRCTSGSEEP